MIALTRDSGTSLYHQLQSILRKMILTGEIDHGSPLPTEEVLAKKYSVSRITVRQALNELEKDKLVTRIQGRGTFISEDYQKLELPKLTGTVLDLVNIEATSKGKKITTKVFDFSVTKPGKMITDRLGIKAGSEVVRIERVRYKEKTPLYYLLNFVRLDIGQRIQPKTLVSKTLMQVMEYDLGIVIKRASQTTESTTFRNSYIAQLLEAYEWDPCITLKRVVYDKNSNAIDYTEAIFRADVYVVTNELLRIKKANKYMWRDMPLQSK